MQRLFFEFKHKLSPTWSQRDELSLRAINYWHQNPPSHWISLYKVTLHYLLPASYDVSQPCAGKYPGGGDVILL